MAARKRLIRCSLGVVLAVSSSATVAQQVHSGWYVGTGAGRARYELAPAIVLESDSSGSSHRFFAGYRFNRNVSVEGAYVDLGEARRVLGWPSDIFGICIIEAISPCNGNVRESTSATAYTLAAIGTIPITDRLSVFGKLGIANVEATRTASQYASTSTRDTRARPFYGLGIRYELISNLALRAEWERITEAYSIGLASQANVQAYSFGVEFQF